MKVLHVQKVRGIGGSERHLLALLPALRKQGVEVAMCVLGTAQFSTFVAAMEDRGVETTVLEPGPDFNPVLVRRLRREIRERKPDIVHTHLIHADLHGQVAARAAGVPAMSTIHGAHGFYRRQPYRSVARVAGHLAKRTIAISDHVARQLHDAAIAPDDRVRLVPYGIDVERWIAGRAERREARTMFGITERAVTVGIASRLIPHKGHDFLIDAVVEAVRDVPEMRLLIAGDGPLRSQLERRAEQKLPKGVVRFLGFIDDVAGFMSCCDMLVFPTLPELSEGFGLAALEAMAAGRPVIATAVGSLPEIVISGETGIVVEPRAVEQLAGAVVSLASDAGLRSRLGSRGQERAKALFSLDAMVDSTIGVYDEVGRGVA